MIIKHDFGRSARPGSLPSTQDCAAAVCPRNDTLLVGFNTTIIMAGCRQNDCGRYLSATRFLDLSGPAFSRINPCVVWSPLFSQEFDAVDIARKLAELEFSGTYQALATDLPDSAMVAREICAAYPGMDFQITELSRLNGAEVSPR